MDYLFGLQFPYFFFLPKVKILKYGFIKINIPGILGLVLRSLLTETIWAEIFGTVLSHVDGLYPVSSTISLGTTGANVNLPDAYPFKAILTRVNQPIAKTGHLFSRGEPRTPHTPLQLKDVMDGVAICDP